MTSQLDRDFDNIQAKVRSIYLLRETIAFLASLGREQILVFEPLVVESAMGVRCAGFMPGDYKRYSVHSACGPVDHCPGKVNQQPNYYLFNTHLDQKEWFHILDYSKEEQLAHILRWGKHE